MMIEDDEYNISTDHQGNTGIDNNIDNNHTDIGNSNSNSIKRTEDDSITHPEPETIEPEAEEAVSTNVEILGNTSNNLMNYGYFVCDGDDIFLQIWVETA